MYAPVDKCILSNNVMDYHIVSQGKTSIPGLDDGEELQATEVRCFSTCITIHFPLYVSEVFHV